MNFNKQQEETINTIEGNVAVIATAGSGKTTVLTHRIKKWLKNIIYYHLLSWQLLLAKKQKKI